MQSFNKITRVLSCFTHDRPKLSLSEIADETGIPKSSSHRLVKALCQAHYLEQIAPNGRYRLGIKLFELGSIYLEKMELNSAAYLIVRRLQQVSGETVHLCMFNGVRPVMVYRKTMVSDPVNVITTLEAAPAYCTGVGKAILAFQSDETIHSIFRSKLQAFTPYTLTTPDLLLGDLKKTRERGYAIDDREHQPNVRCVAAPIRSIGGNVFAGISVSSAIDRIPEDRYPVLAELVQQAAADIEQRLQIMAETQ